MTTAPDAAPARRITLLTDFGTADGYAAAMRGVLATHAPQAIVEDASHAIDTGDVVAATWCLSRYWRFYPQDTVHLVVVDPGVGGTRRAIAARADGRFFIAPDNGVLTSVLTAADAARVYAIDAARVVAGPVSATFHGRDLFAPAAARIAAGLAIDQIGPAVDDPVLLERATPVRSPGLVRGVVIHVDRFGNLITNIHGALVRDAEDVEIGGRNLGAPRRTYADAEPGKTVPVIGSADLLEIAVRDGNAAIELGARRGATVAVRIPSV